MKRSFLLPIAVLLLTITCFPARSWGTRAYVTDPKETALRAGPGKNFKVLSMIPSGTGLEVLKTAEWIQVRYTGAAGETKDGWVQNSSVAPFPP